jgi:hypothetical protein
MVNYILTLHGYKYSKNIKNVKWAKGVECGQYQTR